MSDVTAAEATLRIALCRSILNHREPTLWTLEVGRLALDGLTVEDLMRVEQLHGAGDDSASWWRQGGAA